MTPAGVRVAVADVGTNSTRLLVADVVDGLVAEVERLLEITRLGEGVDARGELSPAARERVLRCLRSFAGTARELGAQRLLAVATSAVRDAADRDAFLAAVAATGFEPRLLSGDEEAAATFAGVTSSRSEPTQGTLVVDVGGGSTEVVIGGDDGAVAWARSFDAGCVRMTERFLGEDAVEPLALERCLAALRRMLVEVPEEVVELVTDGIGVAGTVTTAAALDLGLAAYDPARIHGHRVSRRTVLDWQRRLGAMPLEERRGVRALEPARAPVIVGGLVTLGAFMDCFGLLQVEASERDILHGTALLAARPIV